MFPLQILLFPFSALTLLVWQQEGHIWLARRNLITKYSLPEQAEVEQEGQHPLTGQRAANFRLLANE